MVRPLTVTVARPPLSWLGKITWAIMDGVGVVDGVRVRLAMADGVILDVDVAVAVGVYACYQK